MQADVRTMKQKEYTEVSMKKRIGKLAVDRQRIFGLLTTAIVVALIVLMFSGKIGAMISATAFAAIIVFANCS